MQKPIGEGSPAKQPIRGTSPAKQIAYIAIMTALLIGGQFALSYVAGVEVVTVLLCAFSFVFGARSGVLTAVAFSLLRCFIWGFYPSVIVLYLIYYPLFALIFGLLGSVKEQTYQKLPVWAFVVVNLALIAVMAFSLLFATTDLLKISRLVKTMVVTLLWVIFALSAALFVLFNVLNILNAAGKIRGKEWLKLVMVTAVAAVCTICFSLLDDIITPLFYGWSFNSVTAVTYFYTSFLAIAPQTVCTIATVSTMFLPLTALFKKVVKA